MRNEPSIIVRSNRINPSDFSILAEAAIDRRPVTGWTHNFYRYPARFSPQFAAAAIARFSRQTDLVIDPYMGGGTAVVESVVTGRRVIGNDLNSLAAFITKVKITDLSSNEAAAIKKWAKEKIQLLRYDQPHSEVGAFIDPEKTRNLSLLRARFIKKAIAAALASINDLRTQNSRDFAKCIVLRVGQWALDGRGRQTPLRDFRKRIEIATAEMLQSIALLGTRANRVGGRATLYNMDAAELRNAPIFQSGKRKASLVITSPPYPGVHVLYHRWQVDGRRETPAPYWIAGCNDGNGASFYNFGDRRETAADTYFRKSLLTLKGIRAIVREGAYMVQMLAFNRPDNQLPRYLENMRTAGFAEERASSRIWREVPNRKWHAAVNGKSHSANEVVLVHRAI